MALFPDPDFDELYDFNPIHKAILGLGADPIESVIYRELSSINKTDRFGRSPLNWAATQDDEASTKLLLSRKAQIDQPNHIGSSPLMQAAHFGKYKSFRILLQHGADPALKNQFGMTALHYLMQSKSDSGRVTEMAESLLDAGSDINAANIIGQTPLASAVYHGASKCVELLIGRGADTDICTNDGHSPLSLAVRQNRHSILKALLDCGNDHLGSLLDSGTFMHLVARQADVETLRLLLNYRLKPRNVNVKNKEDLTPTEVMYKRKDRDAEWTNLFEKFLDSVDDALSTLGREPEMAREYAYQWPIDLPTSQPEEQVTELASTDTASSQTAVDTEPSSEDEFVDAMQNV